MRELFEELDEMMQLDEVVPAEKKDVRAAAIFKKTGKPYRGMVGWPRTPLTQKIKGEVGKRFNVKKFKPRGKSASELDLGKRTLSNPPQSPELSIKLAQNKDKGK